MYELDEFKASLPRNPLPWAIPLLIGSIVLFVLATVSVSARIVILPWSDDAVMIFSSIFFFVGLLTSIIVISSYTTRRYRIMMNTVVTTLVDRINLETRHHLSSLPLTGKEKPVIDLRPMYHYSSSTVEWHLTSSEFPRIDIQKLKLVQSSGKSSSITFDGYAIFFPVHTQKFMMIAQNKALYGFGRKDAIPLDNERYKAFGDASLCSPELVRWIDDLVQDGRFKKPVIAVQQGYLILTIYLPVKKLTTLQRLSEQEYDKLTNEIRDVLHQLDELIEGIQHLPIA